MIGGRTLRTGAVIAGNTVRLVLRDRLIMALIIAFACLVFWRGDFGRAPIEREDLVALVRFGLTITFFAGGFLGVMVAAREVSRERESGTLTAVLSKPVGRGTFIFGKFLGGLAVSLIAALPAGGALVVLVALRGTDLFVVTAVAVLLTFCQVAMVAAVATLCSTLLPGVASSILTAIVIGMGVCGHALPKALQGPSLSGPFAIAGRTLYNVLPIFGHLGMADAIAGGLPYSLREGLLAVAYAFAYSTFAICIAAIFFSQREVG